MIRIWRAMRFGAASLLFFVPLSPARVQEVVAGDFKTFVVDLENHQISLHWKEEQGRAGGFCGFQKGANLLAAGAFFVQ